MKVSFPHTDLLIEHLAQGTKVSSILFDHSMRSGTSSRLLLRGSSSTTDGETRIAH